MQHLHRRSKSSQTKRRGLIVMAAIIILAAAIGVYSLMNGDKPTESQSSITDESPEQNTSLPESIEGRYLFSGTIVLARAVEQMAGGDYSQPFSGLDTLQPEKYDAWAADLECPVTDRKVSYQEQVANLVFNCPPEFLPDFANYFQIVSLANNHSSDMGAEGFKITQDKLEKAGIQSYGNYDPAVAEDVCEIIALPVRVQMPDGKEEAGTLPIAFCAWHYFFRSPLPGELEVMERYAERMPVFGFIHAGVEYVATAGSDQVDLAHRIIDMGAEFVIGNSPHWVQNSEVYKDKLIVYSTGNFIFDQLDDETNRGLSIDVTMRVPYDDNLAEWLKLGESCKPRLDTCLEEAESKDLKKFDVKLSYDAVASVGGYTKVTRKADAATQAAVENRLNWAETLKQLGQTSQ